ncbi:MAG: hypothetical protein HYZ20_03730 [Burkholderiales bacterium]|nr:hypothetical protein [Burkholderiales bacterium]
MSFRGQSQQVGLESSYASLSGSPLPQRGVSDRAFAKARAHLYMPALTAPSDILVRRAEQAGLVPRWHARASWPPTVRC